MDNKWIIGFSILALAVGLVFGLIVGPSNGALDKENTLLKEDIVKMASVLEGANAQGLALQDLLSQKDQEIISLTEQISTSTGDVVDPTIPVVPVVGEFIGYTFDELELNSEFSKKLSDKDFSKLIDSEIEFMNDDYNVDEFFYVNSTPSINEKDFEENSYLTFKEDGIAYTVIFEDSLNTSKISEDENLVFNFLGQEVTISEWDGDTITISLAEEKLVKEGESYVVEEKTLLVDGIFNDKVLVSIDGVTEILSENEKATVNGIEVKINEILYSLKDSVVSKVILTAGVDVIEEVISGDEYVEDGIWEYFIDENSIGLVLSEKFNELDDNDGFNALAYGEKLCLPNDYACVEFVGLSEEDTEEYTFDDDGNDVVRIRGKFVTDSEDYDKIYFNIIDSTFSDDNDFDSLIEEEIFFGDSELNLTANTNGHLVIDNIVIGKLLKGITVDGNPIATKEDNYRTVYGIIIEDPEQSVEDFEFNLIIPEEKLLSEVLVY